jgi:hypothetical protein
MRPLRTPMKEGARIAALLNLSAKEPLLREECRAIEGMALELSALTEEVSSAMSSPRRSPGEIIRRRAEREHRVEKFNATHLRPHTWTVELSGWREGTPVFFDRPSAGKTTNLFTLIELARLQLLDRLRKCAHCGIWFFATKPWAIFHDTLCRKAAARSEPGFQERHRKYQGNYFRKKLSVNQKYYKAGLSPAQVRALKKRKSSNKKSRRAA